MGEYADMFLDGLLDEETGELIDGDAPGYPRSPTRDARESRDKIKCPTCGKVVKKVGLSQHQKDKHGVRK